MDFQRTKECISKLITAVNSNEFDNEIFNKLSICKSHEPLWDINNIKLSLELTNNLFNDSQILDLNNRIKEHTKSDNNIGFIIHESSPLEHFPLLIIASLLYNKVSIKFTSKSEKIYLPLKDYFKEAGTFDNIELCATNFKNCECVHYITPKKANATLKEYLESKNSLSNSFKTSALIIDGSETIETIKQITPMVFNWFGRSHLSVQKIFIPKNYRIENILDAFEDYFSVMDNNKYANNYEYHRSVYLMNSIKHYDNGFILLKKDNSTLSPTGVLYYEEYNDTSEINNSEYYNIYNLNNKETFRLSDVYTWQNVWYWNLFFNKLLKQQ